MINQGDIYWVDLGDPTGSGPALMHPHVVIQNNVFNRSCIRTVVVCALTSNLKWASAPGNVLLEPSEANLPKQSVVNVSHTILRSRLNYCIVQPTTLEGVADAKENQSIKRGT